MSKVRQLATDRVTRAHTPVFLQNVSIGFTNRAMIADRVSPIVPVKNQSDKYRVFGKNRFMTGEARWAPGTIPNSITTRWSEDSYNADIRKIRHALLDQEVSNSDSDLQLSTRYTETATDFIVVSREKRIADLFTTAGTYAASHKVTKAGGSEWDAAAVLATDQALKDMQAVIQVVCADALVPATELTVVIPEQTYQKGLQNSAGILARVQYSALGIVTTDLLRALLGVKEVILAASASAGAGPETADSDVITGFTMTQLWGDTVWIGVVNDGTNANVPYFSRSFNWAAGTDGQRRRVKRYRMADEGQEGDWIEVAEALDEKVTMALAGGLVINTLA
jgi:hypothetical protein